MIASQARHHDAGRSLSKMMGRSTVWRGGAESGSLIGIASQTHGGTERVAAAALPAVSNRGNGKRQSNSGGCPEEIAANNTSEDIVAKRAESSR
jgi:hypothetical protein